MKLTSEIQALYKEGQVSIKKTLSNWEYYKYEILLAFKIRKIEEKFLDFLDEYDKISKEELKKLDLELNQIYQS